MTGGVSAIRYRPWQAVALVCISAVVAGTAILAPLYDRALQQALVSSLISQASPDVTSVTLRSAGRFDSRGPSAPFSTSRLLDRFPESVRPYFGEPVETLATSVVASDPAHANPTGSLMSREGMCAHVEFAAGACPSARDQIAISTDDAAVFGWTVGDKVRAVESSALLNEPVAHQRDVEVVGIYTTDPDQAYWVMRPPVGEAGLVDADGATQHDAWLTVPDTLIGATRRPAEGHRWSAWAIPERTVDLLLDPNAVGVDELFAAAGPLESYLRSPVRTVSWQTGATDDGYSGIPELAARAEAGRAHAHVLVPLFVVQLALLAALTLWLVLGAAVDQRRPEVAVLRLRGGDARSCRRQLTGELGPPILLGWVVGVAIAAVALLVIGRRWLDPALDLEVTPLVIGTAVAVLVVELLMLWAATWSTVRASAADLLRRVRPRTGWAVSLGPVVLVVMCGAAFAATAAGSLSGWVAMAAPTLLAIAVGLVFAHLLGPIAGGSGSRLLARGRLVTGLGLLQLGRRHGMRTAIVTSVVAASLLTFAVNALAVGERNRNQLADATVGAPTVLRAEGNDLAAVRAAVRDVDPTGGSATVAVLASSASGNGMSTMAVVPDEFARVAAFPDDAAAREFASALRATVPDPLSVRGAHLSLDAEWAGDQGAGAERPFDLGVLLVRPGQEVEEARLEPDRARNGVVRWRTDALPCAEGCLLTGVVVHNRVEGDLVGTMTIRSATVEKGPVDLGTKGAWRDATPHANGFARPRVGDGGVAFNLSASRGFDARLGHVSVPSRVPAVTSGDLPPDSEDRDFTSVGLDGVLRDMHQVATDDHLPGAPADAALVDLDVLERDGADLDLATRLLVYLGPSVSAERATHALRDHGVAVGAVTSVDEVRSNYEHTAPAWALQLGVVAAVGAAMLAALVLAISFITSWRLRAADATAMRLNGVTRRRATIITLLETVPLVALSVTIGVVCGLVGSRIALPDLPFFDTEPTLPIEDLRSSWRAVLSAGAGLLVALTALGVAASLRVGRRSLSHSTEDV